MLIHKTLLVETMKNNDVNNLPALIKKNNTPNQISEVPKNIKIKKPLKQDKISKFNKVSYKKHTISWVKDGVKNYHYWEENYFKPTLLGKIVLAIISFCLFLLIFFIILIIVRFSLPYLISIINNDIYKGVNYMFSILDSISNIFFGIGIIGILRLISK